MQRQDSTSAVRYWVDKITALYNLKQQESEPAIRSAKHADMMRVMRLVRDSHLQEIRSELALTPDSDSKRTCFKVLDDLITFKMIMTITDELKAADRAVVAKNIETASEFCFSEKNYSIELDKAVVAFAALLKVTQVAEMTPDKVSDFLEQQFNAIVNNMAGMYNINRDQLSADGRQAVKSDLVLSCLNYVINESDKRQLSMWESAKAFTNLYRDDLLKPYHALPAMLNWLPAPTQHQPLWKELADWMRAVHIYHHNLVMIKFSDMQLQEGESYPPINTTDRALQARFGVTFHNLSTYVANASNNLQAKLISQSASASLASSGGLFSASAAAAAAAPKAVDADPDDQSLDINSMLSK